jgi:hypothetical protein
VTSTATTGGAMRTNRCHRMPTRHNTNQRRKRRMPAFPSGAPVMMNADKNGPRKTPKIWRNEPPPINGRVKGLLNGRSPIPSSESTTLEPGKVPPFLEQEEEFARPIMRADALNDARRVLEDLDESSLKLRDKWTTIDLLANAAANANEEVSRYREELGIQ